MLGALRRAVVRYPRATAGSWGLALILAVALSPSAFDSSDNREYEVPGSETARANHAYRDYINGGSELYVVISSEAPLRARSSGYREAAERRRSANRSVARRLQRLEPVDRIEPVARREYAPQNRADEREMIQILSVHFDLPPSRLERRLPDVEAALSGIHQPGIRVAPIGGIVISRRLNEIAQKDLRRAELVAVPLLVITLAIAYFSVTAAALPVVLAVVTLLSVMALLQVLGLAASMGVVVRNTISMIALGLGIDYSLFLVTRIHEGLDRNEPLDRAVDTALATTGRAVALSGISISLAISALFALQVGVFDSMAIGGIVTALVAMGAALTLLPAVILLLGRRLEGLTIGPAKRAAARGTVWRGLTRIIIRRPLAALLLSSGVLLVLASPVASFDLGFQGLGALPSDDPVAKEVDRLQKAFGKGSLSPVYVVTKEDPDHVIDAFVREEVPFVFGPEPGSSGWSAFKVTLDDAPDSSASIDTVRRLRRQLGAPGAPTYVAGISAGQADLLSRISSRYGIVILIAVMIALAGLIIGFRSILIPLKAILGSLLSVAASLGILLLFFPSDGGGRIEFFVPLVLFVVVFGLSIDYEVFLLSRVREEVLRGRPNDEAVVEGVIRNGRAMTLAGLTMAIVFLALGWSSITALQQLGIGMAIAVILDVTLVRLVLIPAATIILGRWNWWLPGLKRKTAD